MRDCYRILANVAYRENKTIEIKKYFSIYQDLSDSIQSINNQPKGKELEQIFLSEKKVSNSQAKVLLLILSIILICILSFGIYIRISKINSKKIKDIEIKNIQKKKETIQDTLS